MHLISCNSLNHSDQGGSKFLGVVLQQQVVRTRPASAIMDSIPIQGQNTENWEIFKALVSMIDWRLSIKLAATDLIRKGLT
ncbi:hypothetical protein GDO78_004886 [Eleutherodactylus coqui]|uniref:Uncharacterized protein n=1 Tax=Eleutherodactylus coqui TaxID=57060 RepID=A0A8J6FKG8_ELECQ|nr:hypothetical protein GDO78_004886 [Eleutherodactylus coqui]